MTHRNKAYARAYADACVLRADNAIAGGEWRALEATVVVRLGDEVAHIRMHAVGLAEEDAAVRGDGGVAVEEVFQCREAAVAGV